MVIVEDGFINYEASPLRTLSSEYKNRILKIIPIFSNLHRRMGGK
jgi:hypothetical protein